MLKTRLPRSGFTLEDFIQIFTLLVVLGAFIHILAPSIIHGCQASSTGAVRPDKVATK